LPPLYKYFWMCLSVIFNETEKYTRTVKFKVVMIVSDYYG